MALTIRVQASADGKTWLTVAGEIDLDTVASLHDAVAAALRDRRPSALIIDMRGVSFIDSTGISGLIRGRRLADAYRASYHLVNVTGTARWVLEVAGVLHHLGGEPVPAAGHVAAPDAAHMVAPNASHMVAPDAHVAAPDDPRARQIR